MISIVIPTYNRFNFLKETIESIKKQSFKDFEIVIIDDNSTDDTGKIIDMYKNLRIKYIKNKKNMGPGYNRKIGISSCDGEYIIFMDDDDYYIDNDFFYKVISIFEKNRDVIFVSANAKKYYMTTNEYENSTLNIIGKISSIEYLRGFMVIYDKPLSTFTTVFKKDILIKSGVLNMEMVNDMAIYLRSLIEGSVYFLEDIVGIYRIHDSNISKKIDADFLIKNLKEKKFVYNYIKSNNLFYEYDKWWLKQIEETVGYFVYGSKPHIIELNHVYKWCCSDKSFKYNTELKKKFIEYKDYLVDLRKCEIKLKIKKILRLEKII